ncbi:MAG: HlyD family efflux transporter periplasmic adaptor subunit [Myxococcales bacterium]|nr:HlyD family efflux transporter periplasmic adaptor subunit [Myxococcales bacterium]
MSEALFRSRALAQAQTHEDKADLVRLSPAWTRWAYWVIVGGALSAFLYVGLARVDEWAQGPALVHVEGATELTAKAPGTIARVAVEPGQVVDRGDLLATLTADNERAQLKRLQQEFDLQLARTLRDPSDQAARQSLVSLRVERDLAQTRLSDLFLRAPRAGVVDDIRVRAGQAVNPGDHILTLGGEQSSCTIWALVPGRYRPELELGALVHFNVHGYRYAQASAELSSVGAQVLGPREVTRYLGNEIAGALNIEGPTVIAKAELPGCTFTSDDDVFRFHQGMGGSGEVQLRSEALWAVLFPDLRKVFRWFE